MRLLFRKFRCGAWSSSQGAWLKEYCTKMGDGKKAWPKIILFGDSLTQFSFSKDGCWGALLADYVQRKCDVIARGFSGYNTRWCKLLLPKLVTADDAPNTQLVTILLGANDSVDSVICKKQHVPLVEYKQNLLDMVEYLQSVGIASQKIVLISPPACDEVKWEKDCKLKDRVFGKFNEPTKLYAKACCEAAEEAGIDSVDFFSAMMNQKNYDQLLNDGLHLSTEGSEFLFELLKPVVDKHIQDLPMIYPYWADIDNANPTEELNKHF